MVKIPLKQAGERLGITRGAMRQMVHRGQIPAEKEKGRWVVESRDVARTEIRPRGRQHYEYRIGYRAQQIYGTISVTGALNMRTTVRNLKYAGFTVSVYRQVRGDWVPVES